MYKGLLHTHKLVVILFLLIYLIKTILLLANKKESLGAFTKKIKVPEMIISFLFLITGVWMLILLGEVKTYQVIKILVVLGSIPVAVIGFKKQNKALAVVSLLMITAAYGIAEMGKKPSKINIGSEVITEPGKAGYDQTKHGEKLFKAYCVSCHGEDGTRKLAGAADLSTSQISKEEAITIITNGKNTMGAYKDILSAEEIEALASYIQGFK